MIHHIVTRNIETILKLFSTIIRRVEMISSYNKGEGKLQTNKVSFKRLAMFITLRENTKTVSARKLRIGGW